MNFIGQVDSSLQIIVSFFFLSFFFEIKLHYIVNNDCEFMIPLP